MNADQLSGIIRQILMLFSGWAVGLGFTNENWALVAGGAGAIVAVVWSLYSNSDRKMLNSVANQADVKKVVVEPGTVMFHDNPKVTVK